jgi:DNA-binding response OmpR family regulator
MELHFGQVIVNRRTGDVRRPDGQQKLRAKELDLLLHLYQHQATPWTRQELLRVVWNFAANLVTRTVDQTVATLHKKVEPNPCRPQFVQTVHRSGWVHCWTA